MAKTYTNYKDRVKALVQDNATKLTDPGDYVSALEAAMVDLNNNHPKVITASEDGDGATYEWTLASWVDGQSVVRSVEYPAGQRIPEYLDDDEHVMIEAGKLRLLNYTPGATESIKISYTVPWTLSEAGIDVPERHFEPICSRAAAVCCLQLAALYGQDTDPTYGGGVIQVGGKLPNYLKLAKEFMNVWQEHFETKGAHESTFSLSKTFDSTLSDGRSRLFH